MRYDTLLLAALLGTMLAAMYLAQRRQLRTRRRACLDACVSSLDGPDIQQDGVNFPVLRGRYRGREVRIEPIVDDLSVRKLPQLWAIVTLRAALPCGATVDAIARPQNTEFYSFWSRLRHDVPQGSGWPADVAVRTDDPYALPPATVLDRLARVFDDVRTKELVISPRGVRLVYQLAQGDRGGYLALRQARFAHVRVDGAIARHLLETVDAVCDAVREGQR